MNNCDLSVQTCIDYDHQVYYCGQESLRRNGVAFIVNKRVGKAVLGYNLQNDRMISVRIQGKPFNITVVQVYAPTTGAEEAEVDRFYEGLQHLLELTPKNDVLIIMGDWNAKVGSQKITGITGKIGLGVQNEAGHRLVEFCQENTMVIANTLFQHPKRRLYTWTSPDSQHRNQIDYVLCSQRWRSSIQSVKTRPGADLEVTNRFKELDLIDRVPEELWTEVCNIVQEAATKTIPKKKKCKKAKWLSEEALHIAEERREAKEHIMRKAELDESPVGIKIAGRNINNLRYADDTTLMAEGEEELKSLLMRVKEESTKVGLKLNIKKTKIMSSGSLTSWQIDGEEMEVVTGFIFLGSKITTDGDCSQEIKRRLLLGRKAMANLDSILKSRAITLSTKVRIVKAMVFPVAMYGCESWTIRKAEHKRIEAFELCGIALDAWMLPLCDEVYPRVHQPLLFINSEKFQWASNVLEMKKLNCKDRERKMITIKGSVHQSFPDFTFLAGNIVGKIFKLKGDTDSTIVIDISNKASLAFLQKHLGLNKDFNQWDMLLDGKGFNVVPGTNIDLAPVAPQVKQ
ncbi:Craniofacial development protein 2 [Varanus komodoensis]|nr:Craniofacial development protein 2 [Varanus komodoensis]